MNRLLALLAFITIATFLLILAFKVPSPDLVIMILVTLGFVAYDLATSSGKLGKGRGAGAMYESASVPVILVLWGKSFS